MRRVVTCGFVLGLLLFTAACSSTSGDSSATSTAPVTSNVVATPTVSPTETAGSSSTGSGSDTIAGSWTGTYQSNKFSTTTGTFHVKFTQSGSTISGDITVAAGCVDKGTVSGQLNGNKITFGAVKAAETIKFTGSISGNSMNGDYQSGPACENDAGTWKASRN